MESQLLDITPSPVALSTGDLGGVGGRILVANVGDDPARWLMAASAPSGMPGFPIARGQTISLSLPRSGVSLWAWALGNTRLMATPLSGDAGIASGPSSYLVLTRTPVQIPDPVGAEVDDAYIVVNAGINPLYFAQLAKAPTPTGDDGGMPVESGAAFYMKALAASETFAVWAWSARGTAVLTNMIDDRWDVE